MEYQFLNSEEKYSTISTPDKTENKIKVQQNWEVGQIIDEKYEIQDVLASDDIKTIHKVRHCQWNIPLAVRSQLEKESRVRFFHQSERWVELGKHPNVVSAYYVQRINEIPRLFVEYVTNAKTLEGYNQQRDCDIEILMDIAIQICWGMSHAHKKGLLHGDLRPGNIFITDDGQVKVTDFRSREGIVIEHTPYMAPEQFEEDWPALPSVDIYAFGVVLYELCTGELPFKIEEKLNSKKKKAAFHNMILSQPPIQPYKVIPRIPKTLSHIIMKCLSVDSHERPKDFDDIIEVLLKTYIELSGFRYPREAPSPSTLMAVDLNNRALSHLDLEEDEKAEEFLEEAVQADPCCTGALINLYLLKLRKDRSNLAQLRLATQNLLDIDKEVVTFYRSKISLDYGGFLEESATEIEEALKEYPENKELIRLKGLILERLGKYEQAIEVFEEITNIDIPSQKDLYHLAFCHLLQGKKKNALEIWDKALELNPNNSDVLLAKGITIAMRGRVEEAYNIFKNITETSDNFWAHLHLAEASASIGDYVKPYNRATPNETQAQQLYEKLLKQAPGLPRVIRGAQKFGNINREEIPSDSAEIFPHWSYTRSLHDHKEGVHCMSLSPDGRVVVAGGADKSIKIWEIETGKCKNILKGHSEGTTQIEISHDGHFAVTIGRHSEIMVWDLITGECVAKLEGHVREVNSIALTCTGYLVSGSLDKTLRIWDIGALSCKKILRGHTDKINCVKVTPDGRFAISGGEDSKIGIWEIEQGICLNFIEGHTEGITCLEISPDGKWAISGSWDQRLRIFEIETGECTHVLEGHTGTLNCIAVSKDSKMVISGSEDKSVRVWNIETGKCIYTLRGHTVDVTCLAVSHTNLLISGSWDHSLRVWDLKNGSLITTLEGHTDLVNTVLMTPDEKYILSGGDDSILRVWNDLTTLPCHVQEEPALSYLLQNPRSKHRNFELQRKVEKLITRAEEKLKENAIPQAFKIYREIQDVEGFEHNSRVLNSIYETAEKGAFIREDPINIWKRKALTKHTDEITCVAISSNEDILISGSKDNSLKVWNIESGSCLCTLKGHTAPVCAIDISPNNRYVISGSYDNSIRLWELETGRCIYDMEGHEHWVEHVKFTPDGRRVISGSRDTNLRIWARKNGHRLYTLSNHTDLISTLKITPDNQYIVSASHDRSIRIWELESGQCLHNLERHTEHVKCIDCLPNKPFIVSGGWDSVLHLWDIKNGEHLRTFSGHKNWINAIRITKDGKKVISASLDKTIKVWDIETGECLATLKGHTQDVNNIVVTEDGRYCISVSWDNTLRFWSLEDYSCSQVLQAHENEITTLNIIKDSRYIITGSKDASLIIWESDWGWRIPE